MTKYEIIDFWKQGLTIDKISELYMQDERLHGIKVSKIDAMRHVEPIIFKYQTGKGV